MRSQVGRGLGNLFYKRDKFIDKVLPNTIIPSKRSYSNYLIKPKLFQTMHYIIPLISINLQIPLQESQYNSPKINLFKKNLKVFSNKIVFFFDQWNFYLKKYKFSTKSRSKERRLKKKFWKIETFFFFFSQEVKK